MPRIAKYFKTKLNLIVYYIHFVILGQISLERVIKFENQQKWYFYVSVSMKKKKKKKNLNIQQRTLAIFYTPILSDKISENSFQEDLKTSVDSFFLNFISIFWFRILKMLEMRFSLFFCCFQIGFSLHHTPCRTLSLKTKYR